ncbi:protein of unknown function [Thauera humireducens]|nr:protein of unknown function [Thauera humireducens]
MEATGLSAALYEPLVNIAGMPIFGDVDAKGSPYGVVVMFPDHQHGSGISGFDRNDTSSTESSEFG